MDMLIAQLYQRMRQTPTPQSPLRSPTTMCNLMRCLRALPISISVIRLVATQGMNTLAPTENVAQSNE